MATNKYYRDKFVVRFTESGLRNQIEIIARDSNRSMNAEIMHRLFRSFELEAALQRANAVIDRLVANEGQNGSTS